MHCKRPWQRSAGRRCGGGYELELAIRCPRSVSRGDTVPDRDRELRAGCCRKCLRRPASCWREDSGEEQKRLGIRGNPGPSSFGSCGVDESAVDRPVETNRIYTGVMAAGVTSRLWGMSALAHFADSSRTSREVREWDGPAALPPPTVLRVRRGLVRKGAPPCPARPLFTQ